jgi:hypothetical protein
MGAVRAQWPVAGHRLIFVVIQLMSYYLTKLFVSAVLIVAVSEIAKRSVLLGGLIASLPLVSLLAMIWLYVDTKSIEKVSDLSLSIFWLVLPTLPMFLALPALLRGGVGFYPAVGLAILVTVVLYLATIFGLKHFGIPLES